MRTWAICQDCDRWNITPKTFKETKHFCKCAACGGGMFLIHEHPNVAGYEEINRTEILVVRQ